MFFVVYKDTAGYYRWRLKAENGRIIADSGEGYNNQDDCLKGIGLVMSTDRNTPVRES
jgi:uncharacterized protein YegP (UPF0339 family)